MIYTQSDLLKVLHDTNAVSVWNHKQGPVFWYAANVPGPFYVNTEKVIGEALSDKMLREITAIIAGTKDAQTRAAQLENTIMAAYKATPGWQRVIATMVARAHEEFPALDFTAISSGERRDWLFSIPFAHAIGKTHLFLFKNKELWSEKPVAAGQKVLHVSDLINNAASYIDAWEPMLKGAGLTCSGNLCINVRGENGLQRLHAIGQKVANLMTINLDYFRHLHDEGLIDRDTLDELTLFFASTKEWGIKYLIGNPGLFDVGGCDAKSFERLKFFVANDPWKLRGSHEGFFASMQQAVDARAAGK